MIPPELPAPTQEQQAILDSAARTVQINARAGTGKTVTLRMLAERFRGQRVLYIVYNARARAEAGAVFPPDVDVRTMHSLAYGSVRRGHHWKVRAAGSLSVVDLLPHFQGIGEQRQVVAALATRFLEYFLNSTHRQLEAALVPFARTLSVQQRADFVRYGTAIVSATRTLATEWNQGRRECPHDFYLKLSQTTGKLARALRQFDVLLIDEGQDLSPVMLEALRTTESRIFIVGDSHQQIYEFRYAVNAMESLPCEEEYDLSMSFRFGDEIADLASRFIQAAKGDTSFAIRGNPDRRSRVTSGPFGRRRMSAGQTAVLARTNLGLFNAAIEFKRHKVPFAFARDMRAMLFLALDVFWLSRSDHERIRDPFLASFPSLSAFEQYAEEMEDVPRLQLAKIIDQHKAKMPGLLYGLIEEAKDTPPAKPGEGILLSTVHAAKGMEYASVQLHEDIAAALTRAATRERERLSEETNIAYVAITRAIEHLHLPAEFGKAIPLDGAIGTEHAPAERQGLQDDSGVRHRPFPSGESRQSWDSIAVGARVRTRHGSGVVTAHRRDGKALVALDDHPAKLWLGPNDLVISPPPPA